ncbi:MAG: TRAP transporter small permease [Bilophila sp.]
MLKKTLLAFLDHGEEYICQALLVFFVLILLLQIVFREQQHPLYWSEEIARYSFVWFAFFGAAYATRRSAHNRVTLQFRLFPAWVGTTCMVLGDGVWLVFNGIMIWKSLEAIQELRLLPYFTPALDWQLADVYLVFPLAFTLMSIRIVQVNILRFWFGKEPADLDTLPCTMSSLPAHDAQKEQKKMQAGA